MARIALLLAASAATALAATGGAEATPGKRCAVRGAAKAESRWAVMFVRTVAGDRREVWGCLKSRGREVLIRRDGGTPDAGTALVNTSLSGRYISVAWDRWRGPNSCSAGMLVYSLVKERKEYGWRASGNRATGCPGLYSFRWGRRGRSVALLREDGEDELHKYDREGDVVLDRGPGIVLEEVLDGTVIHWTKDGVDRYARFY